MRHNLSKKQKIAVSASAAIAAASSLVAPLAMTGCANPNALQNSAIDQEYGVTKETYEDLKTQFRVEYSNKLKKVYLETSAEYKLRMDALEEDLARYDEVNGNMNCSYTALTESLIDFAREQEQKYPTVTKIANGVTTQKTEPYGIQLVRHTRTKWSDLNDLYSGMADSFKTYMHNSKMSASTINKIMTESKAKFDNLTKQLKATYGNDALSGLLKAKEQIITFFDDVNDDVALVSACSRLKDFLSQFSFEYINYDENGNYYTDNCLDELETKYPDEFAKGKILSNELMNKIFTVTRRTTGKTVDFDAKSIVPGYTIQPKLINISQNNFSNVHTISIDFGLVKNVYAQKYANEPEKLAMVTGHNYTLDAELANNANFDANFTLADYIHLSQIQPIEFTVRLTPQEEANRLKTTFFNQDSEYGSISFSWDMNNQAYEAFFDNARQNADGTWTGTLGIQSLANAGLMISNDNKKFTSISKIADSSDTIEAINNQTLYDVFIKNCNLISNVVIDETNSNRKSVVHNFKAIYSNSIYTNDEKAVYVVGNGRYERECINFKVSNNFFSKINTKFNEVAKFVNCYDLSLSSASTQNSNDSKNNKNNFDELYNEALLSLIYRSINLFLNGIALVTVLYGVVGPWKTGGRYKALGIMLAILGLGVASVEGYSYYDFEHNYFKKVKDHKSNVDNCKTAIHTSELMSILRNDLNENFVWINDDGTYDKIKFAQQKAKFEKNSMVDMLNMYRKYATISQYNSTDLTKNTKPQIAKRAFDDILVKNNATANDFEDSMKEWKICKGMKWWTSFACSIATIILNLTITWLQYQVGSKLKEIDDNIKEWDAAIDSHLEKMAKERLQNVEDQLRKDLKAGYKAIEKRTLEGYISNELDVQKYILDVIIPKLEKNYNSSVKQLRKVDPKGKYELVNSKQMLKTLGLDKVQSSDSGASSLGILTDALNKVGGF